MGRHFGAVLFIFGGGRKAEEEGRKFSGFVSGIRFNGGMEKVRRILPAILMTAFLGGFGWFILRPHEPVYQGKTLSVWLEEVKDGHYQADGDDSKARAALRAMSTEALPVLVETVRTCSATWRRAAAEFADEETLAFLHIPPQRGKMEMVGWAFEVLGVESKPAVPALIELANDKDVEVAVTAVDCLGSLGPVAEEAVPALMNAFNRLHKGKVNWEMRRHAARALGEIGPKAKVAVSILNTATNDPSAELAIIKIEGRSLLPFFENLKNVTNPGNWAHRTSLISRLGKSAEPAIPFLISALGATNSSIQNNAISTLGRIHLKPEACVPALVPFLQSTNQAHRRSSVMALRAFGTEAKSAVPEIIKCLSDRDWSVQNEATNALRKIDPQIAAKHRIK